MPIYRDTVIPLADVITPNQFEAEYVSSVLCCVCVCVCVCVLVSVIKNQGTAMYLHTYLSVCKSLSVYVLYLGSLYPHIYIGYFLV